MECLIVSDNTEVLSMLEDLVRNAGYRDVVRAESVDAIHRLLIESDWNCALMLIDTALGLPKPPMNEKREYPSRCPCIDLIRDVQERVSGCHVIVMSNACFSNDGTTCMAIGADDFQSMDFTHVSWQPLFRLRLSELKGRSPIPVVNLVELVSKGSRRLLRQFCSMTM